MDVNIVVSGRVLVGFNFVVLFLVGICKWKYCISNLGSDRVNNFFLEVVL